MTGLTEAVPDRAANELLAAIVNIEQVQPNLFRVKDGSNQVSYPADGSASCLQVEERSFWFQHRNRCIIDLLDRFPPDGAVLDIGGGNGFVSSGLQQHGHTAILLEPGTEAIAAARQRGLAPVIHGRLEDIKLTTPSIQAAAFFDVLEHIEDPTSVLQHLRTMMTDDAKVYLTVPAHSWLWSAADDSAGHYRRYTLKSVQAVLDGSGFRVLWSSHFFAPIVIPLFLRRTVASIFGVKSNASSRRHDHTGGGGFVRQVLDAVLGREQRYLASGHRLRFGSSIIAVGQRT